MDFLQTIFKTNISLVTESKGILKTPEFDASYDPVVNESKGMLKIPEFDASYEPVVTESKGMQNKTPEFHASYDPIVTKSGIYRWRIILADTNFFQQSVSAANFGGKIIGHQPSTFLSNFRPSTQYVHKIPKFIKNSVQ